MLQVLDRRHQPPTPTPQLIDGEVPGRAVQPGPLLPTVEPLRQSPPRPRKRLLGQVLGRVVVAAEQQRQPRNQRPALGLNQGLKLHQL